MQDKKKKNIQNQYCKYSPFSALKTEQRNKLVMGNELSGGV